MTKIRNKFVLALLALCLFACLGIMVACDGDDKPKDDSVTYTVTVKAGDAAAAGVKVTVKKGTATLGKPKITDQNGKAEFKLAEDAGYTVTLDDLPVGYSLADGTPVTFDAEHKLTVKLTEDFAYVIKLVNPDGSAYVQSDVQVGICTVESENCLNPVTVGADGIGKVYGAEKTDYHVQVLGLAAGKAYESDEKGYSIYRDASTGGYHDGSGNILYNNLSDTKTETEIKIYPVTEIKFDGTPLTDAEIAEYMDEYMIDIDGDKAYKFTAKLPAGQTAYYSLKAEMSGTYNIYNIDQNRYKGNATFLLGDSYLSGHGMFFYPHDLEQDEVLYINITNDGDNESDIEFVVGIPAASQTSLSGAGKTEAVIYQAGVNAVVEISPSAAAVYTATVDGEQLIALKQANSAMSAKAVAFETADYKANNTVQIKITPDMLGMPIYLAVGAKSDSTHPVRINITVTKGATLTNSTIDKKATGTLTRYEDGPADKVLAYVPVNGDAAVVKGDDGYYHLGSATGPVIVVRLTTPIGDEERFSFDDRNLAKLAYLDEIGECNFNRYVLDATPEADVTDMTKGKTFVDYRPMLRGYRVKEEGKDPEIVDQNNYARYVNSDGVYPLNDDLKEFLQNMVAALDNKTMLPQDAADGHEWLFPCYCYADKIVGKYQSQMDGDLEVKLDNTYTRGPEGHTISGNWTIDNGNYVFSEDDPNFGATEYTVILDPMTGTLAMYIDIDAGPDFTYIAIGGSQDEDEPIMSLQDRDAKLDLFEDGTYKFYRTSVGAGHRESEYYLCVSGTWSADETTGAVTIGEKNIEEGTGIEAVEVVVTDNIISVRLTIDGIEAPVTYEFTIPTEVDIAGEYETDPMSPSRATLTVNSDGTFSLTVDDGAPVDGTWEKDASGDTYTFTLSGGTKYIAQYQAEQTPPALWLFEYDADLSVDWPAYEVNKVNREPEINVTGVYAGNDENLVNVTLNVNNNGTCTLTVGDGAPVDGTWEKDASGDTYTFTLSGGTKYTAVYNSEDLMWSLFAFGADVTDMSVYPVYDLIKTSGGDDDEEPAMSIETSTQSAKLEIYADNSYKFYISRMNPMTRDKVYQLCVTGSFEENGGAMTVKEKNIEQDSEITEVAITVTRAEITFTVATDGIEELVSYVFALTGGSNDQVA